MEKLTLMLKESYNELLQHVSWPTTEELLESSIVVLVASLLISLIVFLMDGLSQLVFSNLYLLGK